MEVSCCSCSASSAPGPHTLALDLLAWLKSCSHKAPRSLEHGALGPSERPSPSRTLRCVRIVVFPVTRTLRCVRIVVFLVTRTPRCARIVVFPVTTAPDDVDPEAAVGDRKAGGGTYFAETGL